jgi:hypothetical protein
MRHLPQNVNCYVYETALWFGKSAPLGQGHLRRNPDGDREGKDGGYAASPILRLHLRELHSASQEGVEKLVKAVFSPP